MLTRRSVPWLGLVGLVVLVVGTFLPWVRSGRVRRNSYETGGAIRRLLDARGLLDAALTAWPFVGLACALVVATFVLGPPRLAAGLALVPAVAAGGVAVAVLSVDRGSLIVALRLGPAVTAFGALLVILAASLVLFPRGRERERAGGTP